MRGESFLDNAVDWDNGIETSNDSVASSSSPNIMCASVAPPNSCCVVHGKRWWFFGLDLSAVGVSVGRGSNGPDDDDDDIAWVPCGPAKTRPSATPSMTDKRLIIFFCFSLSDAVKKVVDFEEDCLSGAAGDDGILCCIVIYLMIKNDFVTSTLCCC